MSVRASASVSVVTWEQRDNLAREALHLSGRGVDRPEDEGVEAVVDEAGERLGPPLGRTGERIPEQVADRQLPGGRRPALPDYALQVQHAPDPSRVAAGLRGGGGDPLVAGQELLAIQHPERRGPAVGPAPYQADHPWPEGAEPDAHRVHGGRTGAGTIEPVVLAFE